jgi:hypothetical protein
VSYASKIFAFEPKKIARKKTQVSNVDLRLDYRFRKRVPYQLWGLAVPRSGSLGIASSHPDSDSGPCAHECQPECPPRDADAHCRARARGRRIRWRSPAGESPAVVGTSLPRGRAFVLILLQVKYDLPNPGWYLEPISQVESTGGSLSVPSGLYHIGHPTS